MIDEKFQVIIVDDEALARKKIVSLLQERDDIQICGQCSNGLEALSAIEQIEPDLVILDIQMPELDGFELIDAIGVDQMPVTIFVTAYDQYAIQAFDKNALDYVLKPINPSRLMQALDKAVLNIKTKQHLDSKNHFNNLLQDIAVARKYMGKIVIRTSGKICFINVSEIDWIESEGNYINIHTNSETHLLRETMKNIESKLDPALFIRIHRSRIVNIEKIKELHRGANNNFIVVLKDGSHMNMSNRYWDKFNKIIGNYL